MFSQHLATRTEPELRAGHMRGRMPCTCAAITAAAITTVTMCKAAAGALLQQAAPNPLHRAQV